jgi:hypothetical protein
MSWVFNPFTGSLDWTAASSGGTGDVIDSGIVVGQLVQGVTDSKHVTAAGIIPNITAGKTLTLTAYESLEAEFYTDVIFGVSPFSLQIGTATLALNITASKTVTMTATDNSSIIWTGAGNLTIPTAGNVTAALLGTANVFTLANTFNGFIYANAAYTAKITLGGVPAQENTYAGMWLAQASPDTTNFIFLASSTATFLNAQSGSGVIYFRANNVNVGQIAGAGFTILSSSYATLFTTGTSGGNWKNNTGDLYIDNAGSGKIIFRTTANAQKFIILDSGFISIANALTPLARLHVQDTTTTTNAVREVQRIEAIVSTAATGGANGFGVGQTFYGETATDLTSQLMAQIAALWTDATNATRNARYQIDTYPDGTVCGHSAMWSKSAIAGSAFTIIADGAGDVTEAITVQYSAAEITGTYVGGGVVTLEPGETSNIVSDGTSVLTLTCAADGSVTIARSAGTDTFKFTAWMVWI